MFPRRFQPPPCFALGRPWRQYRFQCPPMPTNAHQCPPNAHQNCSAMPFQCPQRCDSVLQSFCSRLNSPCTLTNPVCPATLKDGVLPPWEVAKAYAFHVVVKDVAQMFGKRRAVILGKRVDEYIASKVCLKGGGHLSARAIRQVLATCADSSWYPGQSPEPLARGRPYILSTSRTRLPEWVWS